MTHEQNNKAILLKVKNASKVLCQYCGNYEFCDICQVTLLLEQVCEELDLDNEEKLDTM